MKLPTRNCLIPALAAVLLATSTPAAMAADADAVVSTYADLALAGYEDALATARDLDNAARALIADPSPETFSAARDAWRAARPPYQQTEAFRFGNPVVDAWEGRVNAWPLDEGLIDYVDPSYGTESDRNSLYTANVIASSTIVINGRTTDVSAITPALLSGTLQEAGDIEANVATGYHAIEFLLWGQDLNGSRPGAGDRPWTDYATGKACTHGHCDRRGEYLAAATALLVSDLEEMVANWKAGGAAREALDGKSGLAAILTGMGSLSYGELAGERMKLGLLLHDPEEEHDCFSDNTDKSHLYDAIGIRNVYLGRYERVDGSVVDGPSISGVVAAKDRELDAELRGKLDATVAAMRAMADRAESGEAYDQMIAEGNDEGNATVQAAIDALIDQTRSIERVIAALGLDGVRLEGSDSLDSPNAVFQ